MTESLVTNLALNDDDKEIKSAEECVIQDTVWDEMYSACRLSAEQVNFDVWRWKPVSVREWILGKEYLDMEETIRQPVMDDIDRFFETKDGDPWNRNFDEGVFCEGIGSGKSF